MTRKRALWLMVAGLLLAALLRFPDLVQTPPGLHYDEAANAVLASDIGLRGERPVFISSYTGKEVLFFYGAGLLMRLLGSSVMALRLTSALVGLLTIAVTYWLGRELLADRRIAVIAAALLAVSFWHLLLSRVGFRAITQPLLQALVVAALFRGLKRNGEWAWFALAGVFLGLTAYTYLAARLFPVPLTLALLPVLFNRERARSRWIQLGVTAGVAILVLAPLLFTFAQNPELFWVRIRQVAGIESDGAGIEGTLVNYARSLGMFFLVGDPYWRFNLPGRPLFNWFWGGLLIVGWGVALWRWQRWWYDWQKAAVLLLLAAPFLMVLPTALASEAIIPSNLRAVGLIPFIFYLPALGLVTLLEHVADVVRRPGQTLTAFLRYLNIFEQYEINYAFIVLLVLLLGGISVARDYFNEWRTRSDLFYESDADLVAVADYLNQQAPQDVPTYVASGHYRHPTLAFLADDYERLKWLPGSQALVFPPAGPALYVFPHNSPLPAWARRFLEDARETRGPPGPDGQPLYVAYYLQDVPPLPAGQETSEGQSNFGGVLEVLQQEVASASSGQTLPLTLYWRVTDRPHPSLRPFVHLYDIWGHRWSQIEPDAYPAEQWVPGETIIQRVPVPVPEGTPPGSYRLRVGLFNEQAGQQLPLLDDAGRLVGEALLVEEVTVTRGRPPRERPRAPRGAPQPVRSGLQLLGYARGDDAVATGTHLPLALWWWATEAQPAMTLRLELLRDNAGIILLDTQPVHGTFPFQNWTPPLFVRDRIDPQIPNDLAGGDYRLHLRLLENGESIFTSSLGTVTVQETERLFQVPDRQHPLDATFAGEIRLLGYTLEQEGADRFRLDLVWQALATPSDDYTVFVHVLNKDGSCCLWQQDVMPRQGAYPTSRWLAEEVVIDRYLIELPANIEAGEYFLEVGLYTAETGRRLRISMPDVPETDALQLRPLTVE